MNRLKKKIFSPIITAIVIVLFAGYFITHLDDFKVLLHIDPWFITLLILSNLLVIIVNGIFMKWSVSLFDKRIKIHESVRVSLISSAGNFFAPAGSGLGLRAIYLKKRHNLLYSDYVSILLCNYVIVFFVSACLGLAALVTINSPQVAGYRALIIFMSALLVFAGTAVLVRFNAVPRFAQGARWLAAPFEIAQQISKGWRLMLSHKKTLSGLIALVIINTALMIAITYLIMSSIHISLSLPRVVLYSVLGSLSVFINITPGNLGIKEAVYIAVSGIVGLSTSQILAAALVDRVVLFVVLLLLWLIYARKLYRIDTTLKPTE